MNKQQRDNLITQYTPLARSMAFNFKGYKVDIDDLISSAMEGLIKSTNAYDEKRGSFPFFASYYIKRELCKHVMANNWIMRIPDSNYARGAFFGNKESPDDVKDVISEARGGYAGDVYVIDPECNSNFEYEVDTHIDAMKIHDVLSKLDKNARAFIEGKFFTDEPLTNRELAANLGVNHKSIGHIGARAINRLRGELGV